MLKLIVNNEAFELIVGTMSPMTLIVAFCEQTNIAPPLIVAFPLHSRSVGPCCLPWLPHAADGRRAQTVGRRYVIAYQTVPPTPPDATTPALLPSRNQRRRHLSALCWQERRVSSRERGIASTNLDGS